MLFAPILLALAPPSAAPPATECPRGVPAVTIGRLADLPRGAVKAIGFPIAEAGAPFNPGDVVTPETRGLPFARFISARRCGPLIAIRYQQGGFAYFKATAWLRKTHGRWGRLPG